MESMKVYGRITDDGHQAMTITQIELRTRRVDIFLQGICTFELRLRPFLYKKTFQPYL